MILSEQELANKIYLETKDKIEQDINERGFATSYLLGPSCVGKTRLRNQLFPLWKNFSPLCLKSGYWLINRDLRLRQNLSSDELNAHYSYFGDDIRNLFNNKTVAVNKYIHGSGGHSNEKKILQFSQIVQVEGLVWYDYINMIKPTFIIEIKPSDTSNWQTEQIHRNVNERNYCNKDAIKSFNICKRNWMEFYNDIRKIEPLFSVNTIYNTKEHRIKFKI